MWKPSVRHRFPEPEESRYDRRGVERAMTEGLLGRESGQPLLPSGLSDPPGELRFVPVGDQGIAGGVERHDRVVDLPRGRVPLPEVPHGGRVGGVAGHRPIERDVIRRPGVPRIGVVQERVPVEPFAQRVGAVDLIPQHQNERRDELRQVPGVDGHVHRVDPG